MNPNGFKHTMLILDVGVDVGAGWSRTLGSWQPWGQRKEEMGGGVGGGRGDGNRVSMLVANRKDL